jgi:MFS family permease
VLHVVRSAAAYPAGALADRLGARPCLALGSVLYAGGLALLSGLESAGGTVIVFLGVGAASGLLEPAERVAVAGLAGARMGRAFGAYQSLVGVGSLVAGVLLGWAYQAGSGDLALQAAAAVAAGSLLVWLVVASLAGPKSGR